MPALSVAALVLAVIAAGSLERPGGAGWPAASIGHARAAEAPPDFAAVDLDGRRWSAADLRGRVTLLDFWATWCAPCLAELPRLQAIRARHARTDFEILGISLDATSRRALVSWLNRQRIEWPQVHERAAYSGDLATRFGVDRLPRTILIGRDGRIAAVDLRGEALSARIDALVSGEPGSPPAGGPDR